MAMLFACGELDEPDMPIDEYGEVETIEFKGAKNRAVVLRSTPFVNGESGYDTYRTPSIVKAANGDILAFAGARDAHGDNSRANVVLRRSKDSGRTWEPMQTIAGRAKNMKDRNGLPSAVTLEDGTIILLYMWSKFVTNEDDRGCRRMYMKTSKDNGVTWSSRVNITRQTQKPCREDASGKIRDTIADGHWGWTGLGPVHGIVKRYPPNQRRIIFGARHKAPDGKSYAHIIYSDDGGDHWEIGGSLGIKSSEATVVELPNGEIMLNARSTGSSTNRIVGLSRDGGESFYSTVEDKNLIEPGCQGSLLRYGNSILFSNPFNTEGKKNGTIQRSTDNGATWVTKRTYLGPEYFSGYSDMVRKDGHIGILVEWGSQSGVRQPHEEIRYIVVRKKALGL